MKQEPLDPQGTQREYDVVENEDNDMTPEIPDTTDTIKNEGREDAMVQEGAGQT